MAHYRKDSDSTQTKPQIRFAYHRQDSGPSLPKHSSDLAHHRKASRPAWYQKAPTQLSVEASD